jgi:hypothetical protein
MTMISTGTAGPFFVVEGDVAVVVHLKQADLVAVLPKVHLVLVHVPHPAVVEDLVQHAMCYVGLLENKNFQAGHKLSLLWPVLSAFTATVASSETCKTTNP